MVKRPISDRPGPPGTSTPLQLVEALHNRERSARERFWELVRPALTRLVDRLVAQHQLIGQRERLILHVLHVAETWLRTRPLREFERLSWESFQAAVLLHVAKLSASPFGQQPAAVPSREGLASCAPADRSACASAPAEPSPLPLPDVPGYHTQAVFLPSQQLGNNWFGGDWYGGARASDGSLWLLLADITGHGYNAYLLASTLPSVWQQCWALAGQARGGEAPAEPAELLERMHHLFADCFPEGIYVEATLIRLQTNGVATVAPAGGSRLLLRRTGADQADLIESARHLARPGPALLGRPALLGPATRRRADPGHRWAVRSADVPAGTRSARPGPAGGSGPVRADARAVAGRPAPERAERRHHRRGPAPGGLQQRHGSCRAVSVGRPARRGGVNVRMRLPSR